MWIYGIKLLQLKIFDVSYLFLYLVENLWCLFNIVYEVVYRSVLVKQLYLMSMDTSHSVCLNVD